MPEPTILLQDTNPNGNLEAIVEDDGRVTYLYVNAVPELGREMRAVWLRNAGPAPQEFDKESMAAGRAPQLPAALCRFPMGGQPALRPEELRVEWTEDGEGLFLLERDELLAVVPAWTRLPDAGFSRDCKADSPLALALDAQRLADAQARLQRAERFWQTWTAPEEAWKRIGLPVLEAYAGQLGDVAEHVAMYPEAEWPPGMVAIFDEAEQLVVATAGMSLRAQPAVDRDAGELAPKLRRVELAFAADRELASAELQAMVGFIGGQAQYPWARFAWLGNGHTLDCDVLPKFPAVLLLAAPLDAPKIALPAIDGEPVTLLWIVPITAGERAFARQHGAAKLSARLAAAGVGWAFRDRAEVELTPES